MLTIPSNYLDPCMVSAFAGFFCVYIYNLFSCMCRLRVIIIHFFLSLSVMQPWLPSLCNILQHQSVSREITFSHGNIKFLLPLVASNSCTFLKAKIFLQGTFMITTTTQGRTLTQLYYRLIKIELN